MDHCPDPGPGAWKMGVQPASGGGAESPRPQQAVVLRGHGAEGLAALAVVVAAAAGGSTSCCISRFKKERKTIRTGSIQEGSILYVIISANALQFRTCSCGGGSG